MGRVDQLAQHLGGLDLRLSDIDANVRQHGCAIPQLQAQVMLLLCQPLSASHDADA